MPTFYIDTEVFSTATAVYSDSGLTTKASDGYYKFGGSSYREQSGGLLLPETFCPYPAIDIGETITSPPNLGVYRLRVNVGSGIGMMTLRISRSNDFILPKLTYDGVTYTRYYCAETIPGVEYGGIYENNAVGASPLPCTQAVPNPKTMPEWIYNKSLAVWVDTGNTDREWGNTTGPLAVSVGYDMFLHVFKPSESPTYVDLEVSKYCASGTMDMTVEPLVTLKPIINHTTSTDISEASACADTEYGSYYMHNGAGADPVAGDFIFLDIYPSYPLAETGAVGYSPVHYFKIQAGNKVVKMFNGYVISVTTCP